MNLGRSLIVISKYGIYFGMAKHSNWSNELTSFGDGGCNGLRLRDAPYITGMKYNKLIYKMR